MRDIRGVLVDDNVPAFGLWYDFRRHLPLTERYEYFYAKCPEEIREGERLGFTSGVVPRVRETVGAA